MRGREQSLFYHTVLAVATVLAAAGCEASGDPAPEPGIETIRGGEPSEAQLLIDLRDESRGWLLDGRSGALPLDDALLICPDGTWMRLQQWISAQESELGFDLGDREHRVFSLAAREDLAFEALLEAVTGCDAECYQCPDGAWVCISPCAGAAEHARDEPASGSDGRFEDNHPRDPWRPSSGSGGGSGDDDDDDRWTPPDDGSGQPLPSF